MLSPSGRRSWCATSSAVPIRNEPPLAETGRQLGVKLTRKAEGAGELEVYFDPGIPIEEKIIFIRFVHEHLHEKSPEFVRLRHYVCPHCGTPVANREVAMRRLQEWYENTAAKRSEPPTILCVNCEKRAPLWDQLEELFASPENRQQERGIRPHPRQRKQRARPGRPTRP